MPAPMPPRLDDVHAVLRFAFELLGDAEGVDAREALKAMPSFATELIALASEFSPMLAAGDYRGDQSPLRDYLPTFEGMVTTARDRKGIGNRQTSEPSAATVMGKEA